MKRLNKQETIQEASNVTYAGVKPKHRELLSALGSLNVGESVTLDSTEWKANYHPSIYICTFTTKTNPRKYFETSLGKNLKGKSFSTKMLTGKKGWIIVRKK